MNLGTEKVTKETNPSIGIKFREDVQTLYNLCKTCTGYDSCTFPIDLSKPIIHCAEFKPYPSRSNGKSLISSDSKKSKTTADETSGTAGLCKNCDTRNECTFNTSGEFILNCEEYQ